MSRAAPEIAGYKIVKPLGKGGMGAVYQAIHPRTGAEVAIKVILRNLKTRGEVRERFRREVKAMAMVEHPNLVRVLEAGEDDGNLFFVMTYVDGVDLASYTRKKGALKPSLVRKIALGLFSALQALHEKGILHRDLKPHNVMLDRTGRPILMDLGLTKVEGMATLTKTGALIGSPRYLPPEVLNGEGTDVRSDLYQAGLILLECATGETAVPGETFQEVTSRILAGTIPQVRERNPEFPAALGDLIEVCLALDLEDRIPSAQHAIDLLEGRIDLLEISGEINTRKQAKVRLPPPPKAPAAAPKDPRPEPVPPPRPGLGARLWIPLGVLGLVAGAWYTSPRKSAHQVQGLRFLLEPEVLEARWKGGPPGGVRLVARGPGGREITGLDGPWTLPSQDPDGTRWLKLGALPAGKEVEVLLRFQDGTQTLPYKQKLPRSWIQSDSTGRAPELWLGLPAKRRARDPDFWFETEFPTQAELHYPTAEGQKTLGNAGGLVSQSQWRWTLDNFATETPSSELEVQLKGPLTQSAGIQTRIRLEDLLRSIAERFLRESTEFSTPDSVRILAERLDQDRSKGVQVLGSQPHYQRLEDLVRRFQDFFRFYWESPLSSQFDRHRLLTRVGMLERHAILYRRLGVGVHSQLAPNQLLNGPYAPPDPTQATKVKSRILAESDREIELFHSSLSKLNRKSVPEAHLKIPIPEIPAGLDRLTFSFRIKAKGDTDTAKERILSAGLLELSDRVEANLEGGETLPGTLRLVAPLRGPGRTDTGDQIVRIAMRPGDLPRPAQGKSGSLHLAFLAEEFSFSQNEANFEQIKILGYTIKGEID